MKKSLIGFQNSRKTWFFLAIFTLIPVLIAHNFFQIYLYMRPCEQCVYLRFYFLVIFFVALLVFLKPSLKFLKFLALTLAFWACFCGLQTSLLLRKIYKLIAEADPFGGVMGCKQIPTYPFNLPLHEYFPSLFLPNGECGFDKAFVPKDTNLSTLQEFFIGKAPSFSDGIYSEGWFLLPQYNFLNMAEACFILFSLILFFLILLSFGFCLDFLQKNKKN